MGCFLFVLLPGPFFPPLCCVVLCLCSDWWEQQFLKLVQCKVAAADVKKKPRLQCNASGQLWTIKVCLLKRESLFLPLTSPDCYSKHRATLWDSAIALSTPPGSVCRRSNVIFVLHTPLKLAQNKRNPARTLGTSFFFSNFSNNRQLWLHQSRKYSSSASSWLCHTFENLLMKCCGSICLCHMGNIHKQRAHCVFVSILFRKKVSAV